MSVITTTAEKLTEANIVRNMSLTTESRPRPGDKTGLLEDYRAVFRLTVERDAYNMSDLSQPTDQLLTRASVPCRFNELETIEIFPIFQTDGTERGFNLIGQHFTPKNQRGSKFFNLVQEYVSVSDWRELNWGE